MAVERFASGREDVLIGTDVASKGLDFPRIQHVINYDMPKEIENYSALSSLVYFCGAWGEAIFERENYEQSSSLISFTWMLSGLVHRIGRTGRSGRTGIATTFVTKHSAIVTLLDLRALLIEAKQRVPPFLAQY